MDVNVCGVDWTPWAQEEYEPTVHETSFLIGEKTAKFIKYLVSLGANMDDVNCIGYSLGGQTCGHLGYLLEGQLAAIYGEWYQ